MVFIKIMKSQRDMVSVCDNDLIGKKFEEGKLQLDVRENFFLGEDVDDKKAVDIIKKMSKEDATFYIVGENSVRLSLEAGIIIEEGIVRIQGIPVVLVLL